MTANDPPHDDQIGAAQAQPGHPGQEHRHVFWIASEADLQALLGGTRRLLRKAQCSELEQARILTAASELGHNILRYATRGQIAVTLGQRGSRHYCEVIAQDQGPGIVSIPDALTDHFSSGQGLGLGLPGVKRLVDEFEIESEPGKGTRVLARRWWRP